MVNQKGESVGRKAYIKLFIIIIKLTFKFGAIIAIDGKEVIKEIN